MKKTPDSGLKVEQDIHSSTRKEDHIDLAFKSAVESFRADERFMYEPVFSAHPRDEYMETEFLGKKMKFPIWVSSMTGGTEKAKTINRNLARVCGEFGLGMGLGSCRQLLYDNTRFDDFDIAGDMNGQPFCINLGVAQIEELIVAGESSRITELISRLKADGVIVHINPLQEWLQPEGDRYTEAPLKTIQKLIGLTDLPILVKEVGQGFGKESLKALLQLPVEAVDLAGFGGTNFSKLELLRSEDIKYDSYKDLFNIGHSCMEMVDWINEIAENVPDKIRCRKIIFSGGIKNFLDGFYFINKCSYPSIYGQASGFLKYAMNYEELREHVVYQIKGLQMAQAYLTVKKV